MMSKKDMSDRAIEAILKKDVGKMRGLLNLGLNPNSTDYDGNSLLFIATSISSEDVCKVLLEKGADVNKVNKYENTPLIRAAALGRTNLIKLFDKYNVDINYETKDGLTALDRAKQAYQDEAVDVLKELAKEKKEEKTPKF